MTATKTKLSVTVSNNLAHLLDIIAEGSHVSRSELVEEALRLWHIKRVEEDAKKIAKMEFDDLPTEDEWLALAPKWEWQE